jgi:hypothetical protein
MARPDSCLAAGEALIVVTRGSLAVWAHGQISRQRETRLQQFVPQLIASRRPTAHAQNLLNRAVWPRCQLTSAQPPPLSSVPSDILTPWHLLYSSLISRARYVSSTPYLSIRYLASTNMSAIRPSLPETTEVIFPCQQLRSSPFSSAKPKKNHPLFHHVSPTRVST